MNIHENRPGAGRLVGGIFVGVGLLLLGVAAFLWTKERSFLAHAAHTRGLVVAMREHRDNGVRSGGPTYSPTFTFADQEGREHRVDAHTGTRPPAYRVGENVDVFYPPGSPDQAQLRGWFSQWGPTTILGGMGGGFFLLGSLAIYLFTRQAGRPTG